MLDIDKQPDIHIGNRRIWEARYIPRPEDLLDWSASLGRWVMHIPDAHPLWSWFVADMIHLRDIPGVKPAHKRVPDAGHEFMIFALHPDWKPTVDPRGVRLSDGTLAFMSPYECEFQFAGCTDEAAIQLANRAVQAIANGRLTPDSDRRMYFEAQLTQLVDHMQGKHGPVA
jgi:hypothetical protein